ncbi:Ras protein-specific guanine nucleotide-releasing factor [Rhizoclosmatium sp. JEL0117]|nr:Ras protein-specific guanine nucleotide-releasing factor [Rhizoclosmatium sp. JEL0117]
MEIDRHFKDFKHDYESLLRWQNNNAILTGTAGTPSIPWSYKAFQNDKSRIAGLVDKATSVEDLCLVLWDSFVRDFNHHQSEASNVSQPTTPPSDIAAIIALALKIRECCRTAVKLSLDSPNDTTFCLIKTSEILFCCDALCEGISRLEYPPQIIDAIMVIGGFDLYPLLSTDISNSAVNLVSLMSKTMIRKQFNWTLREPRNSDRSSSESLSLSLSNWGNQLDTLSKLLLDTIQSLQNTDILSGDFKSLQPSKHRLGKENSSSATLVRTRRSHSSTIATAASSTSLLLTKKKSGVPVMPPLSVPRSVMFDYALMGNLPQPTILVEQKDVFASIPAEFRHALRRHASVEDLAGYMTKSELMSHVMRRWESLLLETSVSGISVDTGSSYDEDLDFSRVLVSWQGSTRVSTQWSLSSQNSEYQQSLDGVGLKRSEDERGKIRLGVRKCGFVVTGLLQNLVETANSLQPSQQQTQKQAALIESVKQCVTEFLEIVGDIKANCTESLQKRILAANVEQRDALALLLDLVDDALEDVYIVVEVVSTKDLNVIQQEPVACLFSLMENIGLVQRWMEKLVGMVIWEEGIVDEIVVDEDGVVVVEMEGGKKVSVDNVSRVSRSRITSLESRSLLPQYRPDVEIDEVTSGLKGLRKSNEHIIFESVVLSTNGQRGKLSCVRVKYATLFKLVEHIVKPNSFDAPTILSFLQTYSTLVGTLHLLDILIGLVDSANLHESGREACLLSIVNFIHLWVLTIPHDFLHLEVREKVDLLRSRICEIETTNEISKFLDILDQDLQGLEVLFRNARAVLSRRNDTFHPDRVINLLNTSVGGIYHTFLRTEPRVLAEQLALLDYEIYNQIQPSEILDYTSRNKGTVDDIHAHVHDEQQFGSVSALLNRFNFLVSYVTSLVIQGVTAKARSEMIVLLVRVAKHCVDIKALNAAQAIVSSLASASVYRLTKTWESVPKPTVTLLTSLRVTFSPSLNFHNLRVLLASTDSSVACIPWLGLFFRDIIHIAESNPVYKNVAVGNDVIKMINYDRCWMLSKAIDSALRFQNAEFVGGCEVVVVPKVRDMLLRMDGLLSTQNAQFEASLAAEGSSNDKKNFWSLFQN